MGIAPLGGQGEVYKPRVRRSTTTIRLHSLFLVHRGPRVLPAPCRRVSAVPRPIGAENGVVARPTRGTARRARRLPDRASPPIHGHARGAGRSLTHERCAGVRRGIPPTSYRPRQQSPSSREGRGGGARGTYRDSRSGGMDVELAGDRLMGAVQSAAAVIE
jgi:hypothetical protein